MRVWSAVLVLAMWSSSALSNDGYSEIGIGGLVLKDTDKISMDKEDLFVSPTEIRVAYEFTNLTDKDIEASVVFPLPDLVLPEEYESARGLINFEKHLNFRTEIDGKPFPITLEEKAFANGKDISADLLKAGLPISGDMEKFDEFVRGLTPDVQQNLAKIGALEQYLDAEGKAAPFPADLYIAPQWTVKYQVVRKQVFPAGRTLKVNHHYVPITGASVQTYFPSKADMAAMEREDRKAVETEQARYCFDDTFWTAFGKRVQAENGNVGWPTTVSYILSSGATWAGPIKDFRLVVDKGKPDALVSFCGDGVKKIAPTQFEMRKSNFEPKQDLNVMIVRWGNPEE